MRIFYPLAGALYLAGLVQTALAMSKMRLYQSSFSPSLTTKEADLVAAEATYEGYTDKTITAFLAPYFDPAGGASIQSGTQQFNYIDAGPHTANNIGGAWLEDSTGALVAIVQFANPISMAQNGDSIPVDLVLNYGNSQ